MKILIPLVLDLFTLLVDSYKIYLKNGRLVVFLAALIISFHSVLHLINHFSVEPLMSDYLNKERSLLHSNNGAYLESNHVKRKAVIFLGVKFIFFILGAIPSLFFTVSTTHASALIHGGRKTSIKGLALKTIGSIKRPFVTFFYIILHGIAFFFLFVIASVPFVLIFGENVFASYNGIFSFSALVFYTYVSVVWNLSLVVSILEEKSGMLALGKAAETIKGMKLLGFILNLVLTMLSYLILPHVFKWIMNFNTQSEAMVIVMGLLELMSTRMVGMFGDVAFTVLYHKCKKNHGEEVELEADHDMEYTAPLLNGKFP